MARTAQNKPGEITALTHELNECSLLHATGFLWFTYITFVATIIATIGFHLFDISECDISLETFLRGRFGSKDLHC